MAQINITLSQEEILQVLTGNRDDSLKFLIERILNEIMKAESEEQIGAAKHERTEERQDYRNGTRERELNTRIGTLTLQVPRHRTEPFHTMIFENYKRSESALIATMVQMVVNGVSTRKVEKVVETLCGTKFSKSTVSELCKCLDAEVNKFRKQPFAHEEIPFLMVDATYFKARENHRIVSKAFMVALAVQNDGGIEVVGFDVHDAEDTYSWKTFFNNLKARGLKSVKLLISDAHKSIRTALADVYPEAAWQRCQVHFQRNIMDAVPPKYRDGLRTELREMFTAKDMTVARKLKDEIIRDYEEIAEKAMKILDEGFEDAMSIMCLTEGMRVYLRTTNMLERLNRELKRRSAVIGIFPNSASVLRLMGAVTIEYSDILSTRHHVFSLKRMELNKTKIYAEFSRIAERQIGLLRAA